MSKSDKGKSSRDRAIELATMLIEKTGRLIALPPDRVILSALRTLISAGRLAGATEESLASLKDIEDIVTSDAKGSEALRRILLENRSAQFRSFLRGLLHHHLSEPVKPDFPAPCFTRDKGFKTIQVALLGRDDGAAADMLKQAYSCLPALKMTTIAANEEVPPNIQAVEIFDDALANSEEMTRLLGRNLAVSVYHSCISTADQAAKLLSMARKTGSPFRILYPPLFYGPVRKVKALLAADEIGEVTTIRLRATIGGGGGALPAAPLNLESFFEHPAFEHFLLLTYLGGAVEGISAYISAMPRAQGEATPPAAGLLDCKFRYPGRYGLLDCTHAPDLFLSSPLVPYDLEGEFTGTDGIIWLTRLIAERVQSPALRVRVGRKSYSIGLESGMEQSFSSAFENAGRHLVGLLHGLNDALMTEEAILSAYLMKEKASQAAGSSEVIKL